jgi:hypothetical protein
MGKEFSNGGGGAHTRRAGAVSAFASLKNSVTGILGLKSGVLLQSFRVFRVTPIIASRPVYSATVHAKREMK